MRRDGPQEEAGVRATAGNDGDGTGDRRALWFFTGFQSPPDATPCEDGPDPYGNPDPEWMRIDWPQHLRSIEVDDTRINYVEMGEGEPLVLVHGLGGAWQNWLENIPYFARSHRVVALDLPGFGASPMPPWEISIAAYGHLLHGFCDRLELKPCTLVGNSLGGFVSAEAATMREPDFVAKLVLVSATGISHARIRREPAEVAARMATAAAPLTLKGRGRALRRPRLRWLAFRGLFHAPHLLRPELVWEIFRQGVDAEGFLPAVHDLFSYEILDRLTDVNEPTLIVWGRNDRIVPPSDAMGYAERLRNSRVVIFDRTGHLPQAERPVRFNRTLERFLAE